MHLQEADEVAVAKRRSDYFHSGAATQQELYKALKLAQIQKLNADTSKDWQLIRDSIDQSFKPINRG